MPSDCVLILEDDRNVSQALSIALELNNFRAHCCFSSDEALRFLKDNKPMMILSDYWVQEQTPVSVLKYASDRYGKNEIPVIIMSALSDFSHIKKQCKADSYLEKPFELEEFMDRIIRILTEKEFSSSTKEGREILH